MKNIRRAFPWLGVVTILVAFPIVAYRYGWSSSASVAGLDIIGATILTMGVIAPWASYYRNAKKLERGSDSFVRWWLCRWPEALAAALGEPDPKPDYRGSLKDAVVGLVFLVIGFVGQALGVVSSPPGGCFR